MKCSSILLHFFRLKKCTSHPPFLNGAILYLGVFFIPKKNARSHPIYKKRCSKSNGMYDFKKRKMCQRVKKSLHEKWRVLHEFLNVWRINTHKYHRCFFFQYTNNWDFLFCFSIWYANIFFSRSLFSSVFFFVEKKRNNVGPFRLEV